MNLELFLLLAFLTAWLYMYVSGRFLNAVIRQEIQGINNTVFRHGGRLDRLEAIDAPDNSALKEELKRMADDAKTTPFVPFYTYSPLGNSITAWVANRPSVLHKIDDSMFVMLDAEDKTTVVGVRLKNVSQTLAKKMNE